MSDEQEKKSVKDETDAQMRYRLIEETLESVQKNYKILAENTIDVIWTRDLELNLTYVSPAIKRLTSYSPEAYMALPISQRYTPRTLMYMQEVFADEIKLEGSNNVDPDRYRLFEMEHKHADGSVLWVEVSASFLRDDEGKPIGILGVGRDITERKQNEKDKRALEVQFQQMQKMESIGRLAGGG